MIVKWIVCFWCCPVGCLTIFFCFVSYAPSYFSGAAPCRLKLTFFFFFAHSSDKLPAVNLSHQPPAPHASPTHPQESVEGTGFVVVNRLCCSMLVPKGNPPSVASLFSSTHSYQNQCMCSVVVVAAMVAWSLQPIFFYCIFQNKVPGCVTLWVLPWSQDPKTVPLINFIQSSFWEKKSVFFIYIFKHILFE